MTKVKTVLFPLGPTEVTGDTQYAMLHCAPGGLVTPYWGANWDDAIASAEEAVGSDDWITLSWMESVSAKAKGKGRLIAAEAVPPLAWALANFADPVGVTRKISGTTALPMMKAMGRVAVMRRFLADGQSHPFQLELVNDDLADCYVGAYDLSSGDLSIILTSSSDNLRKIYETGFGNKLPDDVQFILGQIIDDDQGAVGHATGALYGGGFRPKLRSRLEGGVAGPCNDHEAQLMTMALMRIPALVQGSTFESGQIELAGSVHEVDMYPIDLD